MMYFMYVVLLVFAAAAIASLLNNRRLDAVPVTVRKSRRSV
jgi:hypothetical protein